MAADRIATLRSDDLEAVGRLIGELLRQQLQFTVISCDGQWVVSYPNRHQPENSQEAA